MRGPGSALWKSKSFNLSLCCPGPSPWLIRAAQLSSWTLPKLLELCLTRRSQLCSFLLSFASI